MSKVIIKKVYYLLGDMFPRKLIETWPTRQKMGDYQEETRIHITYTTSNNRIDFDRNSALLYDFEIKWSDQKEYPVYLHYNQKRKQIPSIRDFILPIHSVPFVDVYLMIECPKHVSYTISYMVLQPDKDTYNLIMGVYSNHIVNNVAVWLKGVNLLVHNGCIFNLEDPDEHNELDLSLVQDQLC